ncbi:hypothetical protein [Paraliomyxa miuraensis]|uniref:hypothetical protein n=1 Tax=Paraliomyxa miuraensis TaxID=376150 RepID=UPI002253F6CE|nr:hypothetical protein [Paraliomyxa miuraensis]MCX4246458.1 hypothetical protein [Paraliomyxa miuraensis]
MLTSTLGAEHKDELERLLFFNRNQARLSRAVALIAQRYGPPRVTEVGGHLRVELESFVPQALFAVHQTPAGVVPVGTVIYTREEDAFVVLFVAVHEDFTAKGPMAGHRLMIRMTDELRAVGRRVKGVRALVMFLGRTTPLRLAI